MAMYDLLYKGLFRVVSLPLCPPQHPAHAMSFPIPPQAFDSQGGVLETPQQHVAFVLDLSNNTICHVFSDPKQGLFIAPLALPPAILMHAANVALTVPRKANESILRDLAPYAAPFLRIYNEGVAAVMVQQEVEARIRAEELTLVAFKEAEEMAALPGKTRALGWLSTKASEMRKERREKKAASDAISIKTTRTKMGLMGGKKSQKDSDAVSVLTTTSFFAKGGDWCKTSTQKAPGAGLVKRLAQTFFFSAKRTSSKTPPTDIRADYLARSPSTSTNFTASSPTSTAAASSPRDQSTLSVPAGMRETIMSGPDWSRVDNWDDSTVEAMFLNERYTDNNILAGPMFE